MSDDLITDPDLLAEFDGTCFVVLRSPHAIDVAWRRLRNDLISSLGRTLPGPAVPHLTMAALPAVIAPQVSAIVTEWAAAAKPLSIAAAGSAVTPAGTAVLELRPDIQLLALWTRLLSTLRIALPTHDLQPVPEIPAVSVLYGRHLGPNDRTALARAARANPPGRAVGAVPAVEVVRFAGGEHRDVVPLGRRGRR